MISIKDETRFFEIGAVILTGFGKFLFMDYLDLKLPFILFACVAWIFYLVYKTRNQEGLAAYWGLSFDNFTKTFKELFPVFIILVITFVLVGHFLGLSVLNVNIIPILLIYPIWGVIQQFIIIGLLAKNLRDISRFQLSILTIVLITALIFAIVHFPHVYLVIGTFFLALVYTYLFLKNRNLLVLGIYHGWLGAFFYYCILSRDTFQEVFKIIN